MAKSKIIDYVNDVEMNRQRLMQKCKDNGVSLAKNSSLSTVVTATEGLQTQVDPWTDPDADYCFMSYIDIDGTLLHEDRVKIGDPIPAYTDIPNYDPEYLEFDKWAKTHNLTIAEHDIHYGALYRVKEVENFHGVNVRPTILKVKTSIDQGLDFTLSYAVRSSTTSHDVYIKIDWGDNVIDEIIKKSPTSTSGYSQQHTYTAQGSYIIKVYTSEPVEFTRLYTKIISAYPVVTALYLGNMFASSSISNWPLKYLNVLMIPDDCAYIPCYLYSAYMPHLNAFIWPSPYIPNTINLKITSSFSFSPNTWRNLKYLIIDYMFGQWISDKRLNGTAYTPELVALVLPDGVAQLNSMFQYSRNIQRLYLPSTLTNIGQSFKEMGAIKFLKFNNNTNAVNIVDQSFTNLINLRSIEFLNEDQVTCASNCFSTTWRLKTYPSMLQSYTIYQNTQYINFIDGISSIRFSYSSAGGSAFGLNLNNIPNSVVDLYIPNVAVTYLNLENLTNLESLDLSSSCVLDWDKKDIILPKSLKVFKINPQNAPIVKPNKLIFPSGLTTLSLYNYGHTCPYEILCDNPEAESNLSTVTIDMMYGLHTLKLPKNVSCNISLRNKESSCLSEESWINLYLSLKDNTGNTASVLTLNTDDQTYLKNINYENSTLFNKILSKNWTISTYSTYSIDD